MARIQMKPAQLYVDSLGFTRMFDARAFAESGVRALFRSGEAPERFSWSSSSPEVASVSETGLVTSLSWGETTISATTEGVTGEARVVVRDAVHLAWSVPNLGEIVSGATIGFDGTIYVTSRHQLHAFSPEGAALWSVGGFPGGVVTTPGIADDGTLYVGALSGGALQPGLTGGLVAVRPDGGIDWLLSDVGGIGASPTVSSDGTIYVASTDGHLYAVSETGSVQWAYDGGTSFYLSSPAIASDGTIYVGGYDWALHAVNPDGSPRWTFGTRNPIQSSPAIGPDGTIYVGSLDQWLYAIEPDGTERWRVGALVGSNSSPSIGPDGTVYVGGWGISAIDPGGSVRWTYEPNGSPTTPVLGVDGAIYVAGVNKSVVSALDAQGRLLWDHQTGSNLLGSLAIGIDGTILGTSAEGTLYGLVETESTNGGFDSSPWPKVNGNRANTGRIGGPGSGP